MKQRANAEQQRRMIAESAFRVLARDGLEGLSMRKVAADAGCTIGLINHWFSSKEALVMTAWQAAIELEQHRGDALRAGDRFPIEDALLTALPTTAELRRKELVWLAFRAMSISNAKVRQAYVRHYAYARRLLADELMRRGYPPGQAEETADLLIVATDGVATMAAMEPRRWPATKQRAALKALIEAVLGPTTANDGSGDRSEPRPVGRRQGRSSTAGRGRTRGSRTRSDRDDQPPAPPASARDAV